MSEILKHVYNACDPVQPATPQYYYDCGKARGDSALTQRVLSHLNFGSRFICLLFSGHIGCGKSSELEHLRHKLKERIAYKPSYFPVLLNASEYLDDYDTSLTDILLAIVTGLASILREELGIEIKDNYFTKRINEIKEFFLSEVEIKEGDLPLWGAKLKIQRLKKDPDARKKVRQTLESRMSTMLEEINIVFEQARVEVLKYEDATGNHPYKDFVLILDNLEKIRKIENVEEGEASQRELFLERYTQLTGMKAHVIYTVPLRLARSAVGPQLQQRYGELFVLPMIKVIERVTRDIYEPGLNCIRGLLEKRLEGHNLNEVFEEDALNFLLKYSGGHARNLMTFVQNACTYSINIPIKLEAAQRAVLQTVRTYSTAIPESHWIKLAQLDRSSDQKVPNGDGDYMVMLENLSVLEYINGDDGNIFEGAEP